MPDRDRSALHEGRILTLDRGTRTDFMKTDTTLKTATFKTSSLKLALGATCLCAQLVSASVRYVDLNSTNATPPFTNWQTAAVTIQAAVDAADPGE